MFVAYARHHARDLKQVCSIVIIMKHFETSSIVKVNYVLICLPLCIHYMHIFAGGSWCLPNTIFVSFTILISIPIPISFSRACSVWLHV